MTDYRNLPGLSYDSGITRIELLGGLSLELRRPDSTRIVIALGAILESSIISETSMML